VHHHIPSAITIFVDIIDLSSGLLNALLFSITRPILFPYDPPSPDTMIETTRDIAVVEASLCESLNLNEVASSQRLRSLGLSCCESWDEKLGVKGRVEEWITGITSLEVLYITNLLLY
jgi:hypothetical protein